MRAAGVRGDDMGSRRVGAAALVAVLLGAGTALVAPTVAGADGTTPVEVTCSGIPIIGSTTATADVDATDDVDPVVAGGQVINTLHVPVPVGNVPISVTVTEVKLTVPIPTGVTVTDVTFTASSFPTQTWSVNGSNLIATFTGSVPLGGGAPTPTVPDVKVKTTVAGPPRTVQWKVPSAISAKATSVLGGFTASCTPTNTNLVLLSTTVVNPNHAPTATDQSVPVAFNTATPVTLTGTDPDADPLTFATTSSPAHGALSGTAPNLTYTPTNGYVGPDSFTFSASDGSLSDSGTVSITVSAAATTVPGTPTITGLTAAEGEATVTWTPPASDGGSPITGYAITPLAPGVIPTPRLVDDLVRSTTFTGLANGIPHWFKVEAVNSVGTGPGATSASSVTPQWWLPWSSGPVAVNELFTWMTGVGPTDAEKTSWVSQLDAGTKLPGDLVAALRVGPDATANVDPTVRLYSAYLTRIPDAGGLNFWLGRRRNGWTLSRISNNFASSAEFKRRYGSLTNRKFVENIYANVLERAGEETGIAYWTRQLDTGKKNRGQVMINFSESNEYKTKQVDRTQAAVFFIHVRGITPSVADRDAFIVRLLAVGLPAAVREQLHLPAFATRAG